MKRRKWTAVQKAIGKARHRSHCFTGPDRSLLDSLEVLGSECRLLVYYSRPDVLSGLFHRTVPQCRLEISNRLVRWVRDVGQLGSAPS